MKYTKYAIIIALSSAQHLLFPIKEPNSLVTPFNSFVVNTENETCSVLGKSIIESGGNAVDSAIASAICIGVVNSFSSGVGGGGFIMINTGDDYVMLDFREVAPNKTGQQAYQANNEYSKTGGLSTGVPGEVLGLYKAHQRFGKLPWKALFDQNIKLAKSFKVSKLLALKIQNNEKYIRNDEGMRKIFVKNGNLLKEGDTVERINYSSTLETISKEPTSFYTGALAKKIVKKVKSAGGLITEDDMGSYKVIERKMVRAKFDDYYVYTPYLPTAGILVINALKILEHLDLADVKRQFEKGNTLPMYHILIETLKFVMAKRGMLGDPSFMKSSDHWCRY